MTHRQFRAWHAWLAEDMSRPSRADHYAMQTTAAVCNIGRGLGVLQNGVGELKELVISFAPPKRIDLNDDGEGPPIVTKEMIADFEKKRLRVEMKRRFMRGN